MYSVYNLRKLGTNVPRMATKKDNTTRCVH